MMCCALTCLNVFSLFTNVYVCRYKEVMLSNKLLPCVFFVKNSKTLQHSFLYYSSFFFMNQTKISRNLQAAIFVFSSFLNLWFWKLQWTTSDSNSNEQIQNKANEHTIPCLNHVQLDTTGTLSYNTKHKLPPEKQNKKTLTPRESQRRAEFLNSKL